MEKVLSSINDIIWNPALVGLLLLVGMYFSILTSGCSNVLNVDGTVLVEKATALGNNYTAYTQYAVDSVFSDFGGKFVAVAMFFFVFTTLIAYYFYAESSLIYLLKKRSAKRERIEVRVLQVLLLGAVVFGAATEPNVVWKLGDIGTGLMTWITVISILILSPKAFDALKEYEQALKNKK